MDRIGKVLFILPFLTLADTMSTEFSLMFGGMEGGLIAGPVCERYGQLGLVALTIFAFFFCMHAYTPIAFPNTACHPVRSNPHILCVCHLIHENRNETAHKRMIVIFVACLL